MTRKQLKSKIRILSTIKNKAIGTFGICEKPKIKSREKIHGEVYTPKSLVDDMLNKLPNELWKNNKTFCDPACGDGNFLIEIFNRKIKNDSVLDALKTIYGADIMSDSIRNCRIRLLTEASKVETITKDHIVSVLKNIAWVCLKSYAQGSLDYDFSFCDIIKDQHIEKWLKNWNKTDSTNLSADLPVSCARAETKDGEYELF